MRLNLGPLHSLQSFAKETVEERGKEYFRKYPPRNLNLTSTSVTISELKNSLMPIRLLTFEKIVIEHDLWACFPFPDLRVIFLTEVNENKKKTWTDKT